MTVKGQAIPAYDPRGLKGMGIAYATSNRGACHLRAYTPAAELGVMPFGSLKVDPLEWKGKGELTKVFQDVHAVSDSLDLCKFSAFAIGIDEYTQQFNAVTGLDYSVEELLTCGERIYNLERYYNNLAGLGAGRTICPSASPTNRAPCPVPRATSVSWTTCWPSTMLPAKWENGVVPEAKLKKLAII